MTDNNSLLIDFDMQWSISIWKDKSGSPTTVILWWGKRETSHEFMLWADGWNFYWMTTFLTMVLCMYMYAFDIIMELY